MEEAEISVGSVLDGRYRIDSILGTGGMGRVYRGEHVGIGKQVAIKVLHADLSRNREAAQRFQREALASGRLDHPNIVGVSDFGIVDDGPCYLVMEVLDGEALGARLSREKRLPWREAVHIVKGVLAGLRHAHDRGVVHRDIKPDNVFLATKDGETTVKILDFGIAKLYAGSPDDPASTRAGLTVGTPAYLSPEQAVGGEIKPASDLYSTTILLFEMLTGRAPFEDKDPLAMLGAHVSQIPPTLAQVAPDAEFPLGLEELIQHGLVKQQADRINSAQDYIARLEALERGSSPVLTPPPGSLQISGSAPTALLATTPPPIGTPMPFAPTGAMQPASLADIQATTPVNNDATTPGRPLALARATHAIGLAETPVVPPNRMKQIAIVVGAILLVGIIAAVATRGSSGKPDPKKPEPVKTEPVKSEPKAESKPPPSEEPKQQVVTPPPEEKTVVKEDPTPAAEDDDASASTELKALLHDLRTAKTCPARKAAIPKIVALGDKAAIPALKKARYRMVGGVLGFNQSNANNCLKKEADAAIKQLGK
ncbi:MAG TPA: protein kinase [Kofleriaceae bacterium]